MGTWFDHDTKKTRQDYFIVRPPAHYNRSKHSDNSNSHGSNDGLKFSVLVFKALKTKVDNFSMVGAFVLITLGSHNIPFSDPATTTQYLSWKNWARRCYIDNMRVQASFLWACLRARCRQPYSCINYARTGRPSHLNENSLAPDITFFPLMMNN